MVEWVKQEIKADNGKKLPMRNERSEGGRRGGGGDSGQGHSLIWLRQSPKRNEKNKRCCEFGQGEEKEEIG